MTDDQADTDVKDISRRRWLGGAAIAGAERITVGMRRSSSEKARSERGWNRQSDLWVMIDLLA